MSLGGSNSGGLEGIRKTANLCHALSAVALGTRDLKGALAFVTDAHDVDASEPLTTELLDRLTELVGCEYASYEEHDWSRRTVLAYVHCSNEDPLAVTPPYVPEDFWSLPGEEHPRMILRPSAEFEVFSDRFDRRERERMRDEAEFNAKWLIVDRILFRVVEAGTRTAWLHFDSQRRDFGERDRELALTLRPHVEPLWRKAVARRQRADLLAALERNGDVDATRAIVLYKSDGRIDHATNEAHRLLAGWFASRNGRLPPELDEWAAKARPGDRHTERRNGSVLTVEAAGDFMLTLNEHCSADAELTPREREVLRLVAQGLTNAEIARKLWVTQSTVAKHLEHAYPKLGVHSRTAAVARLAKSAD